MALRPAFFRPVVLRLPDVLRAADFLRPVALRAVAFLRPPVFLRAVDLRDDDLRTARLIALPTLRTARFTAPARFFRLTAIFRGVTFLWR
ncbi:MAG: hypothetical protein M3160_02275 [Candidatus Eremiobacteraeota bacterium]|nr:hypothetical protein [Candidatus Eremiobacteraeota bacterium]